MLWLSQKVVWYHANLEPNWRVPTPPVWLGVALAAALIAAAIWRSRWGAAVVAALLVLLLWHPFAPDVHPGELELTAIDVGQGDSLLVVFPDGKRMLVDGGGIPAFGRIARSQLDIGEDVVAPYLWDRGFRTLDVVALSHAHEDHSGGLAALIADFHPREVWTGFTPDGPEWQAVHDKAVAVGARIVPLRAPGRIAFGGAAIEVLAPTPDYVPVDYAEEQRLAGDARDVRPAQPDAQRRRGAGNRTGDALRQRVASHRRAQGGASREPHQQHGRVPERRPAGVRA